MLRSRRRIGIMVQHLMSLIATDQCIQDNLGWLEVGAAPSPADEDPQDAVIGGGGGGGASGGGAVG
jgi:hypothetical protein